MAATSETRAWDAVVTSSLEASAGEMQDNIAKAVPFLAFLRAADKVKKLDGGLRIKADLMYGLNSTVKGGTAYGLVDTTPQDGITAAFFDWKEVKGSLTISYKERRQNSSKAAMFNLVEAKKTQLEISCAQEVARQIMLGTGSNGVDLQGLPLAVEATTVSTSYGGIDPSTETWWANQVATAVSSWAVNGLDSVRTMFRKCSQGQVAGKPNLLLIDPTVYDYFEKEHLLYLKLAPTGKMSKQMADLGIENFEYKGGTVMSDEQLDGNTKLYMLNTDYLFLAVDQETDFRTFPAVTPSNQTATVAIMELMANIAVNNRRKQGVLVVTGA
jgi:hypothetical protein